MTLFSCETLIPIDEGRDDVIPDEANVRQNVNMLEFPIWTVNTRDRRSIFSIKTKHGTYIYRANKDIGIPDSTDINVLYYLLWVAQNSNTNKVTTTFYSICKGLSVSLNSIMYDRIEKSIDIWSGISIKFDGNYYNKKKHTTMYFQILKARVDLTKEKKLHYTKKVEVTIDDDFLNSLKEAGMFDTLNFHLFMKLKNPLSKRLYEYLPKHFADGKKVYKISCNLLFDKLRLEKRKYKSEVLRQFNSIQKALDVYNDSQNVDIYTLKVKPKHGTKTDFICDFTKTRNKKPSKDDQKQIKKDPVLEPKTDSDGDVELIYELLKHGITSKQMQEFEKNNISNEQMQNAFYYYLTQLKEDKIVKNKAAYLYKAIVNGWGKLSEEEKVSSEKKKVNEELKKKSEMFDNPRFYGLSKEQMIELQKEIVEMYEKIGNRTTANTYRSKDIDFIMR